MPNALKDLQRYDQAELGATSLGLGPRYLHSTGQAYKGGPSFGVVEAAQTRGDRQVLGERRRRAVRVHLGRDVRTGPVALRTALERALA